MSVKRDKEIDDHMKQVEARGKPKPVPPKDAPAKK
jgi:hypothetical protein